MVRQVVSIESRADTTWINAASQQEGSLFGESLRQLDPTQWKAHFVVWIKEVSW